MIAAELLLLFSLCSNQRMTLNSNSRVTGESRLAIRVRSVTSCCILWGCCSAALGANQFVYMGHKDQVAGHQPQAQIEVLSNDGSFSFGPAGDPEDPLGGIFGSASTLLVDTGASSFFLMNDAETSVKQNGYVVENQVLEQGVSGFSLVDVSAPYQVRVTGDDEVEHSLTDIRLLSGQFPDLFGVNGLIGMPGMLGRTMTIDLDVYFDPLDPLNFQLPSTVFSNSLPADNGHRYSIPLTGKRFDLEDEPPLPTSAPLPMLSVEASSDNLTASGQFLLDTGASISFISSAIAESLGLDSNGDGSFDGSDERHFDDLPIGGVGGTIEAPMFLIDTFRVETEQAVDLLWDEVFVLVLDVAPEIDGVFGADAMTSGLLNLLGLGEGEDSPIDQVSFDFLNLFEEGDPGRLVFDLHSQYDVVQADFDGDNDVDQSDLPVWETEFGTSGGLDGNDFLRWQRQFTPNQPGDFDGNGYVVQADLNLWQNLFGEASGYDGQRFLEWQRNFDGSLSGVLAATSNLPEPSAALLGVVAAMLGMLAAQRHSRVLV